MTANIGSDIGRITRPPLLPYWRIDSRLFELVGCWPRHNCYVFDGLHFVLTCHAFPEQYTVRDEHDITAGYVWCSKNALLVDYPWRGDETILRRLYTHVDTMGLLERFNVSSCCNISLAYCVVDTIRRTYEGIEI